MKWLYLGAVSAIAVTLGFVIGFKHDTIRAFFRRFSIKRKTSEYIGKIKDVGRRAANGLGHTERPIDNTVIITDQQTGT